MSGADLILPEQACSVCGYSLTDATAVSSGAGNNRPSPGDISICLKCGEIRFFTDDLKLRDARVDDSIPAIALKAQRLIREERPAG